MLLETNNLVVRNGEEYWEKLQDMHCVHQFRIKNLKHQLPSTEKIKLQALTEPEQEIQIDFSGKLHDKHVTDEPYILIGIVRIYKSTQTKEVKKFLESFINLYGFPEKKNQIGAVLLYHKNKKRYVKKNIETEYSPPRLYTGTGAVERAIQTLENSIIANLKDKIGLSESINRALRVAIHDTQRTWSEYIRTPSR